MKSHLTRHKVSQPATLSRTGPSAGRHGAAVAPPSYGIDSSDRVAAQAGPQNPTGLPDVLKNGVEALSGLALDDVRVHYNSPQPTGLQALAYTRGSDIHVAPGQERHLPHEAWHVVQQMQGRVQPTLQRKTGVPINDNPRLEKEADEMGQKAAAISSSPVFGQKVLSTPALFSSNPVPIQRKVGFEFELGDIKTAHINDDGKQVSHTKGAILSPEARYDLTADINEDGSQLEFVTDQFDETDYADLVALGAVAECIEYDIKNIIKAGLESKQGGWVRLSALPDIANGKANDYLQPKINRKYAADNQHLPGQLQMTGGVNLHALAAIVSGTAMPKRDKEATGGTVFQDYALKYHLYSPSGVRGQPVFHAARGAVNGFVTELGTKRKGLTGKVRGALAAVVTLMAEIPLNMYGQLQTLEGQAQFLARTDFSKILKMICDENGLHLDPDSFASALISTINQVSQQSLSLKDDVFPKDYQSAGQQLGGVTIGDWARNVVPTPGKYWGRWQGTDLITKRNFPGTQAQKNELRAFGGFGNKTDPGDKVILEWRNFQMLNADQLAFVVTGLAEYLKDANISATKLG